MKYAIIQSGGKQYRCEEGAILEVDRLPVQAGATHAFTDVLLIASDGKVKVGTPTVPRAKVTATVLEQIKGPKLTVFRYKAKERQRKKTGHRQQYTRLKIEKIAG
jgi:large subunit ribosomal protein L21